MKYLTTTAILSTLMLTSTISAYCVEGQINNLQAATDVKYKPLYDACKSGDAACFYRTSVEELNERRQYIRNWCSDNTQSCKGKVTAIDNRNVDIYFTQRVNGPGGCNSKPNEWRDCYRNIGQDTAKHILSDLSGEQTCHLCPAPAKIVWDYAIANENNHLQFCFTDANCIGAVRSARNTQVLAANACFSSCKATDPNVWPKCDCTQDHKRYIDRTYSIYLKAYTACGANSICVSLANQKLADDMRNGAACSNTCVANNFDWPIMNPLC